MSLTPIKKIVSTAKGVFDAADTYAPLDIVMDESGSKAYMAIADVPAGSDLTNPMLWAILIDLSGVAAPSRINAASVGIPNDGTECSAAVQNLLNVHPTLYFPPGIYNFDGIVLPDNADIIFDGAVIDVLPNADYIFNADGTSNITIKGGRFRKTDGTFVMTGGEGKSGVFKLVNCVSVVFENVHFDGCSCGDCIYLYGCSNVNIRACRFNDTVRDCIMMKERNVDVNVDSCSFTNVRSSTTEPYAYGVATGRVTTSDSECVHNLTVSNCHFYNCDWEACDSHGGVNVRIVNNEMHNCYRFIACFSESVYSYKEGCEPQNAYIGNNYCHNDEDYILPTHEGQTARGIICTDQSTGKHVPWRNYVIENLRMVNPAYDDEFGAIAMLYDLRNFTMRNVEIINTRADLPHTKDILHPYGIQGIQFENIVIRGWPIGVGGYAGIALYGCTGTVRGIRVEKDIAERTGGYILRLSGMNNVDASSLTGDYVTRPIYNYSAQNAAVMGKSEIDNTTMIPTGKHYNNSKLRAIAGSEFSCASDGTKTVTLDDTLNAHDYVCIGMACAINGETFVVSEMTQHTITFDAVVPAASGTSVTVPSATTE